MPEPLSAVQLRVLGALAEKEATVPDTYPMTLKGLQTACNQRNSREPVTDHDEGTIQRTLDELKVRGLVRFVYASHGARSTKYRHVLDEQLRLSPGELALLAVLALRGPQTLNELRTRTERAHPFADVDEVVATLEDLADRDDPLVVHLPRRTGQKETRWMHLLGGPVDADGHEPAGGDPVAVATRPEGPVAMDATGEAGHGDQGSSALEARVAALEDQVASLSRSLRAVLDELGVPPSSGND